MDCQRSYCRTRYWNRSSPSVAVVRLSAPSSDPSGTENKISRVTRMYVCATIQLFYHNFKHDYSIILIVPKLLVD